MHHLSSIQIKHSSLFDRGQSLMLQEQFAESSQLCSSSYFFLLQGHNHYMEVIIKLNDLIEIFLLHFVSCPTHLALVIWVKDLIDDDVVDVDLEFS